ncbi:hypothetical protein PV779_61625, partial [Streptomyces sp. ID01-9D]|nr:hypothetical protein [Streptomyces sp. ID01-9D]
MAAATPRASARVSGASGVSDVPDVSGGFAAAGVVAEGSGWVAAFSPAVVVADSVSVVAAAACAGAAGAVDGEGGGPDSS